MVYCIGLTGGIASGKSTAAKLFCELGIEIINADAIAKELTEKKQTAYKKIVARHGTKILDEDGNLNRKNLRTIIFSDPKERQWLEHLLHPMIREQIKNRVNRCLTPYCIIEIPLLLDKKTYPYIDRILLIDVPVDTQIERVMQRDHCSREQALAIVHAQSDVKIRLAHADDILINNAGLSELKSAINELHHQYLSHANHGSIDQ